MEIILKKLIVSICKFMHTHKSSLKKSNCKRYLIYIKKLGEGRVKIFRKLYYVYLGMIGRSYLLLYWKFYSLCKWGSESTSKRSLNA